MPPGCDEPKKPGLDRVNYREMNSFKEHIFIHKKYNQSRQLYSFTELCSFQGTYQFIQGNVSSFKENIFMQGNYTIQGNIFIQVQGHMFILERKL